MESLLSSSVLLMTFHAAIVIAIAVRVIMRRPARGIALSWLLLIVALPYAGALLYLLIGERRIGRKRSQGLDTLRTDFRTIAKSTIPVDFTTVDWPSLPPAAQAMDRLGRSLIGSATVRGSRLQLFSDTQSILAAIARDVDAAETSVLMEFYIWNEGGAADEVLEALIRAAGRGVKVTLIVPEQVDSFLTRYASRSYYDDLLEAGVAIQLYRGGLLHTKSISVDRTMSMFGTVNLDMRSLWLNYEVALFVYQPEFTEALRALQQTYIEQSARLDPGNWAQRPFRERLIENTLRLFSPLL